MSDEEEAPDEDERESELPVDKVEPLLERVQDDFRKVGLYLSGVLVQEDARPDDELEPGEQRTHRLMLQFDLGDLAFSTRMDAPEVAATDDTFREIANADIEERVAELRGLYGKGKGEDL